MSANLAIWNMHAKYQLIQAIHLARAMGVVRNSPPHLIIGGCLYNVNRPKDTRCSKRIDTRRSKRQQRQ